jgi:hypothetical protein
LDLQNQTIHAAPHIGATDSQPNSYTRGDRDHRRSNTLSTRSIPIRRNHHGDQLRSWQTRRLIRSFAIALAQLKTWFAFTSSCRATIETDEPGANDAATISRFGSSGHERCLRWPYARRWPVNVNRNIRRLSLAANNAIVAEGVTGSSVPVTRARFPM